MTNKVYRVSDDELDEIMGETQIREFAISQVHNCSDDFIAENICMVDEVNKLVEVAQRILNNPNLLPSSLTMKEVELILTERCFDIEELNIY